MEKIIVKESELTSLIEKVIANEIKRKTLKETIKKSLNSILKESFFDVDSNHYPKTWTIYLKEPIYSTQFGEKYTTTVYNQPDEISAIRAAINSGINKENILKAVEGEQKDQQLEGVVRRMMNNVLKEDRDFYGIQSSVAYPKGGNIGGAHKQPIKDKDFNGIGTLEKGGYSRGFDVNTEWMDKQVERLLGVNNYSGIKNNRNMVRLEHYISSLISIIDSFKNQRGSASPDNVQWIINQFKSTLNSLPKEFSEHFGIDRDSDKSILSFLDHGTDSLIGNYMEFNKIISRGRPSGVQEEKNKKSSKKKKFDKVMGEFGAGTLKTPNGKKVTDQKQALAIAYSESGLDESTIKIYNIVENVLKENIYDYKLLSVDDYVIVNVYAEESPRKSYKIGQIKDVKTKIKEGGKWDNIYTVSVEPNGEYYDVDKTLIIRDAKTREELVREPVHSQIDNFGQYIKEDSSNEGVAQNNPKIEKYVNSINELIAQAFDSEGDPLGVIDPTSTWEEPYIYDPIVYQNGALKIVSRSNYQPGKINTDIVKSRDMELDGIPTLQLLSRMYKKAIKNNIKNKEAEKSEESLRGNRNGVFGSIH